MASPGEIYSLSDACQHNFELILEIPQLSSITVIEVLHERFMQWASYLGALARDSVSLDSRLTHSDSLRSLVIQFLEIINRNLARVESLEHQHPVARARPDSVIGDVSQRNIIQSPLVETLQVLEAAVDGLHRLGVAIRRSSSDGLDQRAESFMERKDDGTIQKLFLFRLKHQLIDQAKSDDKKGTPLSLCHQLASSISSRYFRVLYLRSHQKKLETRRKPAPPLANLIKPSNQKLNAPGNVSGPAPRPKGVALAVKQRHTHRLPDEVSDSAPTIPHSKRALEMFASSRKGTSTVGGISQVSVRLNNVIYPDLPKPSSPSNTAVCPYCTELLKGSLLGNRILWERHVDKDLQLYACISEDCLDPPQLFSRFDEWANHMRIEHSINWSEQIHKPISWCCDTDHEEIYFCDERLFDLHMEVEHPEYETASDIAQFKEWCETLLPRPPYTCPICNCVPEDVAQAAPWLVQSPSPEPFAKSARGNAPSVTESFEHALQQKLASHVATHLKQLGLMSLIYLDGDEDESNLSRQASTGAEKEKLDFNGSINALDPEFLDYVAPEAPDPLEEGLFDLDWTRVKDLCESRQTLPWSHAYEAVRESDPSLIERYEDRLAADLQKYAAGTIYSSLFAPPEGKAQDHAKAVFDTDYASLMEKLGIHLRDSYLAKGPLDDLEASLFFMAQSLKDTPEIHSSWPSRCSNVGLGLSSRYSQSGSMEDLVGALDASRKALEATPEAHPNRADYLYNLSLNLGYQYARTDSRVILFEAIDLAREAIDHIPKDHPNGSDFLANLGDQLVKRYLCSDVVADLHEAIHIAQAVLNATDDCEPQTLVMRGKLGERLRLKYLHTGDVDSLDQAIKMAREVAGHSSSIMNGTIGPEHLMNLAIGLKDRHLLTGSMADLAEAIALVKEALNQTDKSHLGRSARLSSLGSLMSHQYSATGDLADLNQSIDLARQAAEIEDADHPSKRAKLMNSLASSLRDRYTQDRALADLEQAVKAAETALLLTPYDNFDRASYMNTFALCLEKQYERTGTEASLDEALRISGEALDLLPEGHTELPPILSTVGVLLAIRFSAENHPARGILDDIEKAMKMVEEAVRISPEGHTYRATFLSNTGHVAGIKYMHRREPEDLAKGIEALRQALVASPENSPVRAASLSNLGRLLKETGQYADMEEASKAFALVLDSTQAPKNLRISAGRLCLATMDVVQHSEEAYEIARRTISVVSISAPVSMRLVDRQHILSQTVGLASDAAAIALYARKGRPAEALKVLETCRDIIAGSLQKLRMDLSDLRQSFPELASSFEEVRELLDRSSVPASGGSLLGKRESESVADEMDARRTASARMDAVLSEIHRQPGFEYFLGIDEAQMCDAATPGPIVVVNISEYACAAIIIENSGIQVLELEKLTYAAVEEMASDVRSVICLEWLWEMIVGPVLDLLDFHKMPSSEEPWPHVWWIPTGPLEGFPLHAAGHHFSTKGTTALDRVVSSYSSSVQALIYARKQRVPMYSEEAGRVKVDTDASKEWRPQKVPKPNANAVLVSMPNTPGHIKIPLAIEEIRVVKQACESMGLLCVQPRSRQKDVLAALYDSCRIFHFVGHGDANRTDPMESQLLLEDWQDNPLTARDVFGMNLVANSPFLAFLATSGTCQILDRRAVDENIHVARAFQSAGFRHVIGALWEVSNDLCVETAKMTYQKLCDGGMTDVSVSEGLHHALRRLRDDWVRSVSVQLDNQTNSDSLKDTEARLTDYINSARAVSAARRAGAKMGIIKVDFTIPTWAPYVHLGP